MLDGRPLVWQVGAGTMMGFAFAIPTLFAILKLDVFASFRTFVLELPDRLDVSGWNPLWLGLCAGVGEELLFRGALQLLLGLWWTALLFVLVHSGTGRFQSMNLMKWGYAAFLFLVSLMFGLVLIHIGLIAAIVLHAAADAIIFYVLRAVVRRQVSREP
jgi:membrane protease YdiL (CAAX protease family)